MKKILVVVAFFSMLLVGCGEKKEVNESKKIKVGIAQFVSHKALDRAKDGFIKVFKDENLDVDFDIKNANADMSMANLIANNMVASKKDLIYAIATPMAQAVSNNTETIPILFSAVTDPKTANLIRENVSGVSDMVDIKKQIELFIQLFPNIKSIGVLYNSSESNSKIQIDKLNEILNDMNLNLVSKSVTQASEIPVALDSLVKNVDGIYMITDNLVSSMAKLITDKANSKKIPTFGAESALVEAGALISQGIDYFQMGEIAGKIAIEILKNNKSIKDLAYKNSDTIDITINSDTAKIFNLDENHHLLKDAIFIK